MVSNDDGTALEAFEPGTGMSVDPCVDKDGVKTTGLTYEGELNKVASNVIIGR